MATGTVSEQAKLRPAVGSDDANAERYHAYIEQQLDKTRSYVRTVDIAAALTTLLIGVFGMMLAAAVVDHWLVPGGLGALGRWVFFLAMTGGACYYAARFVLPLLVRRINPLYAARALEQSEPTLKNSLINFLLLRSHPQSVRAGVLRAVESRAARDLTHVSVDTAVDRSHLIKLGYVLVGVLVAFAAYVFISPKNPLPSIGRVIAPWGDIDRPSRVTIEDTKHTPSEVFRGQKLTVSTLVHGLGADEPVTLYWSTADAQVAEEPVVMHREENDPRHRATIPADDENGLRQDISYWIAAGDARTPLIEVPVLEEQFINVDEVRYEYPAYTGKPPASQTHGDIRAVEGTIVTIVATANQPIRDAHLDFDCDGTMDELASAIDGRRAEFRFPLALSGKERQIEQSTYWVRFFTEQDRENVKPVKQRIEVLPDWPPEVNIVEPQKQRIEALPTAAIALRLRARDNDYGLDQVGFVVEKGAQRLAATPLLSDKERPRVGESWLERSWTLELAKHNLKPGDVVHVFAEATDNKQPRGQRRSSREKIEIVIIEPPQAQRGEPKDGQPQEQQNPNGGEQPKQPDMREPEMQPNKQPMQGNEPKQGEPQKDGMGENGGMQNPQEGGMGDQKNGEKSDKPMNGGEQGMGSENGANGGEQGMGGEAKPKDGMNSGGKPNGGGQKSDDKSAQPMSGEPTENGGMNSGAPQDRPVNPNDDRDVIDKLNQHREQQQQGGSGDSRPKGGMNDGGMSKTQGMEPSGDMNKSGDMQKSGGQQPKGDMQKPEQQPSDMTQGDGQKKGTDDAMSKDGMNGAKQPGDMTGKPMNGEKPDGTGGMKPMDGGEQQPMKADDMTSGDGMNPKDKPQGSPMDDKGGSAGGMKPDNKNPMSEGMDGAKPAPGDESQMSKGEGKGEQKTDGNVDQKKKGQGNQADDEGHGKRDGEGTAGSSTSKDAGAGKSEEQGKGETSDMAGDDKQAKGETGKSDESKMGQGSRREGTGDKQGGKPSKDPDSAKSPMNKEFDGGTPDKSPGDGSSGKAEKQAQEGKPNGFGGEKEGQVRTDAPDEPPRAGDDAAVPDAERREYARKATELALDHLKEELAKSDSDLFDKKDGLTREQAEAWAKRMEEILKNAEKSGNKGAAKEKLDKTLDNLGIRPQRSTVGRGTTRDEFRDVRRGVDIPPPPGYEEHNRAYKKAISESK